MIFDELYTPFRWYDSIDKQNRYKSQCANVCNFELISPCNDLLPFQIKNSAIGTPTQWLIHALEDVTIPEVLSTSMLFYSYVNLTTSILVRVTGYGEIGNAANNIDPNVMLQNLADSINNGSSGFTAELIGSSVVLTSPEGTGDSLNGLTADLYAIDGGIETLYGDYEISGGVDAIITDTIDISSCTEFINSYSIGSNTYLIYNGGSIPGCMSDQLPCGKYYSSITDGSITLFSEIFTVKQFEDSEFEQIEFPSFCSLRFYDSLDKQTRYKTNCETGCTYYTIVNHKEFPTFQIKAPLSYSGELISKLIKVDGSCEFDVNYTDVLYTITLTNYKLIISNGENVANTDYVSETGLDSLPCGKYYWYITDGTNEYFSEVFDITTIDDESEYYLQTDDGIDLMTDSGLRIEVT